MVRVIIDARHPDEYSKGHVEGAYNIPPDEVGKDKPELTSLPKDSEIIVYCLSGKRSDVAIRKLHEMGFTDVVNGISQDNVRTKYL